MSQLPWAFPALPPKIGWPWPWPWDLVGGGGELCVFENAPAWKQQQLCPWARRGTDPHTFQEPPGTCVPSSCHCDPRGCGAPWFVSRYFSTSLFFPWDLSYPCSWPNEDIVSDVPSLRICLLLCQAKNCLLPWFCLILPVFGESAVRTLNAFLTWGMYFRVWWAGCPPQSRWSL